MPVWTPCWSSGPSGPSACTTKTNEPQTAGRVFHATRPCVPFIQGVTPMKHCAVCGFSFLKLDAMPDGSFTLRFYCPGCPLSHVAAISLEIKSIDDLARACNRLGLELVR